MKYLYLYFKNLKPFGIADLTASTASDDVPHSWLLRNNIFLVSTATQPKAVKPRQSLNIVRCLIWSDEGLFFSLIFTRRASRRLSSPRVAGSSSPLSETYWSEADLSADAVWRKSRYRGIWKLPTRAKFMWGNIFLENCRIYNYRFSRQTNPKP